MERNGADMKKQILTNHMRRALISSMILHALMFVPFFALFKPDRNIVKFDANVLRLSLSGIKIKKSDANADTQETVHSSGKGKATAKAEKKGKDKVDAMSCMNLKVKNALKSAGVRLPRRYFVQVYTDNAAVEGAWYVDKWLPEAPRAAKVDQDLFEAFAECIRNSNFAEWGRKAVNYAAARRSISFAVEFVE